MDFTLTEAQEAIRQRAREFAEKEIAPTATERDEREEFSREIFDKMGEAGFAGIPYPAQYGGAGLDFLSFTLVAEELARVESGWVLCLASHSILAGGTIFQFGSEELKQKYLVPLAQGKKLACFSLTEPGAGSDAASLQTTATLEGDEYVLNGRKVFATNAGDAEIYVIFAMTDKAQGTRGISCFVVEKGTPGLSFGPKPRKLGVRGTVQRELILENCRIPKANIIGQEGAGFRAALGSLDWGRVGIAAQGLGIAQGALDNALNYGKTRIQFGKPIAENQAISFMLADMATETEAVRLLVYRAASVLDQGKRATQEAAMAKMYATDVALKVSADAVQIMGGLGCTKEAPVERFMRDAKVTQIYEGTNQVMRMVISGGILR